jgi:prevent-host-death family protein
MGHTWQIQEAKNKLSEVLKDAVTEGPQIITRHGEQVAVVLSYEDYARLVKPDMDLVTFFRSSPLVGVELDLERDQSFERDTPIQ